MTKGMVVQLPLSRRREMTDVDTQAVLMALDSIFILKKSQVFRIPEGEEVVFLMSGGMDSAVGIDVAIRRWKVLAYPLFIRRGARAEKYEEAAFDYFVDFYRERYPQNVMKPAKIRANIPSPRLKRRYTKEWVTVFGHPMRDIGLQSVAMQYAVALNTQFKTDVRTIFTAVTDGDIFPHSSLVALRTATLAACLDSADWSWQITSPFAESVPQPMSKREVVEWAAKYGIPLEKTRTCVSGSEVADGACPECRHRLTAFEEAGFDDPLQYQPSSQGEPTQMA